MMLENAIHAHNDGTGGTWKISVGVMKRRCVTKGGKSQCASAVRPESLGEAVSAVLTGNAVRLPVSKFWYYNNSLCVCVSFS